ncbi:MAG: high frequency lysogenization protein HflD [Nitrospirae bacterium]|nr:MAG: high frequency lysogenization protein HflD [Nitrospirota bacterium]
MDTGSFGFAGIYLASFVLGMAHALEPGHGKTVVAAYLAGEHGRNRDAILLGLTVTFTHSFSIILLAVAARLLSRSIPVQAVHAYIGMVSGVLILVIGLVMLRSRIRGLNNGHHHHDHDHHHHHHDLSPDYSYTKLLLLGISGGMVPCPAALAILLAAISTGRTEKGVLLVLIFSAGLAITLVMIGLVVVNGLRLGRRFLSVDRYAQRVALLSAMVVTLIGVGTVYSSLRHLF